VDGYLIGAIVAWVYAVFVIVVAIAKPKPIWEMAKIQGFVKMLGETGTVVFFIVWALLASGLGYWLFTKADI
jgi:ABC-type transport system involved in multi-copper enzyme maturation permease subunit